jgi:hypothetical protein
MEFFIFPDFWMKGKPQAGRLLVKGYRNLRDAFGIPHTYYGPAI